MGEIFATEPLGLIEMDQADDPADGILFQFARILGSDLVDQLTQGRSVLRRDLRNRKPSQQHPRKGNDGGLAFAAPQP